MRRISAIILTLLTCLGAYASELVLVGKYKSVVDKREFSVIAEYEEDKILSLQIETKPLGDFSSNTSIIIEGEADIQKFNVALQLTQANYNNFKETIKPLGNDVAGNLFVFGSEVERNGFPRLKFNFRKTKFPKIKTEGVYTVEYIDYERYDVFDHATTDYYLARESGYYYLALFFISNGGIRSRFSDGRVVEDSLKSSLGFLNNDDLDRFIELTQLDYIKERMELKKSLQK